MKGIKMNKRYCFKDDIPECPNVLKNLNKRKIKKTIKKIVKFQVKQLAKEYRNDLMI